MVVCHRSGLQQFHPSAQADSRPNDRLTSTPTEYIILPKAWNPSIDTFEQHRIRRLTVFAAVSVFFLSFSPFWKQSFKVLAVAIHQTESLQLAACTYECRGCCCCCCCCFPRARAETMDGWMRGRGWICCSLAVTRRNKKKSLGKGWLSLPFDQATNFCRNPAASAAALDNFCSCISTGCGRIGGNWKWPFFYVFHCTTRACIKKPELFTDSIGFPVSTEKWKKWEMHNGVRTLSLYPISWPVISSEFGSQWRTEKKQIHIV